MARCMQTNSATVASTRPVVAIKQPRSAKTTHPPEIQVVGVVKKTNHGSRSTNRNLTVSRRMKIENFRALNEANPSIYGVPGGLTWLNSLLDHFNEPDVISVDNVKSWFTKNAHIRRLFTPFIPFGQLGIGVFSKDRGIEPESERRRRGKRSSDLVAGSSDRVERNSEDGVPDPEVLKRMKIEKPLESLAPDMDVMPAVAASLDADIEHSNSTSDVDGGIGIEGVPEEAFEKEPITSDVESSELQALKNEAVTNKKMSNDSDAETEADEPEEKMDVHDTYAEPISDDKDDEKFLRPPTPGNFLFEGYHTDTTMDAAMGTVTDPVNETEFDRIMREPVTFRQDDLKTDNAFNGLQYLPPIDGGQSRVLNKVEGESSDGSDEAYGSTDMFSLEGSGHDERFDPHQPGPSASTSNQNLSIDPASTEGATDNIRAFKFVTAKYDGEGEVVIEEGSRDDMYNYGFDLITEIRKHCMSDRVYCLPIIELLEFAYKCKNYQEIIASWRPDQ